MLAPLPCRAIEHNGDGDGAEDSPSYRLGAKTRSTANWHNLRSLSIVSGVRLFEPAPLDWPMSQPNLLNLDIAHHVAMTHP